MSDTPTIPEDRLVAAVGAILFASGEPVQPKEIAAALKGAKLADVKNALEQLEKALVGNPDPRGFLDALREQRQDAQVASAVGRLVGGVV